ncbi:MAG: hypothetical protein M0D55_02775 [Elusimicrobiota bacterium]|nr:MAG: hypothetical protein M0D55_02775 [Elusimicrobiota bacterium]
MTGDSRLPLIKEPSKKRLRVPISAEGAAFGVLAVGTATNPFAPLVKDATAEISTERVPLFWSAAATTATDFAAAGKADGRNDNGTEWAGTWGTATALFFTATEWVTGVGTSPGTAKDGARPRVLDGLTMFIGDGKSILIDNGVTTGFPLEAVPAFAPRVCASTSYTPRPGAV